MLGIYYNKSFRLERENMYTWIAQVVYVRHSGLEPHPQIKDNSCLMSTSNRNAWNKKKKLCALK